MRVLHILENHDNDHANYAAEVILGLQQTGIEQCAVVNRRSSCTAELEKSGIETVPLAVRTPWRPSRRMWLRRLIDRLRPDVAHCWTRAAARWVPASKIPVVGWLAGNDHPRRFVRCTHFVSPSRDAVAYLAGNSAYEQRARFIPVFSGVATVPPFNRSALATSQDAKVLLSLAPLHPASRLEILLAALKNLPACIVWFAGEGPLRRELEDRARAFGVIRRVRFASSRLNRGALLRAADLCVLTAPERPYGTIVPQSWAAGTPVVASRSSGFTAPIEDGADGLLAPVGDEKTFSDTVHRILAEDGLRRRLIAKGYASYLGAYAREAVIRQWAELYRKMAARD